MNIGFDSRFLRSYGELGLEINDYDGRALFANRSMRKKGNENEWKQTFL